MYNIVKFDKKDYLLLKLQNTIQNIDVKIQELDEKIKNLNKLIKENLINKNRNVRA